MGKLLKLFFLFSFVTSCEVVYAQHYTTGENWVTRYLQGGGDIKNITGLVQPKGWERQGSWDDVKAEQGLPSHFDWNDFYKLQPIKNQGSCGSCWAFSVTAVVESLYWIRNGGYDNSWFDLAEQTLVSSCANYGSCSGGYFTAFNYIEQTGLPHESDDRYQARNTKCKSGLRPLQKIVEWKYIGDGGKRPTTEQLKTAIYHYGPISVDVNGGFGGYSGGVYTGCGSTGTNHMVTIEGWTDDEAYAEYGGGYWRMRNSWGTGWGEGGYMNIVYKSKRGANCNGIGNVGAYAIIEGLEGQAKFSPAMSLRKKLSIKE
jgi:C1A family cysteine protease